ncbi:MAG: hypothetical protein LUH03_05905 [Oscillospiraceae bacterium]|nr:hypothetical protein [Oscillospiraceae bacterium]
MKQNTISNSLILNISVIFANYFVGFIICLLFAFISFVLYVSGSSKECNDFVGITGFLVQCLIVCLATVLLTVFHNLKMKDIFMAIPMTALSILLIERFCFMLTAINLPWSMTILPAICEYFEITAETGISKTVYISEHLYLLSTTLITIIYAVVEIISLCAVYLMRKHNKKSN